MRLVAVAAAALALVATTAAWGQSRAAADPRQGGLEVGMGEWAVALEAKAIRPGEVTFVIANRGKRPHGFRIRAGEHEAHHGGHGRGGDRFEVRSRVLRPGETARVTVKLAAGVYEIDCHVEGHDDLGMETRLEVRADAPLVPSASAGGGRAVEITGFRFRPQTLRVPAGATVKWTNADAAPHTASSTAGAFSSPQLARGGSYSRRFTRPGRYAYVCALHPAMRATIVVTPRR